MKLLKKILMIMLGGNFRRDSQVQQPPNKQTWTIEKNSFYCRYSVFSLIAGFFSHRFFLASFSLIFFGIFVFSQESDLNFSHFALLSITGGFIISVLISVFFFYRKKSSERLYFDTRRIALFKGKKCQWMCAYQDISLAKIVEVVPSDPDSLSYPEARLFLKNRGQLTIPWGMNRLSSRGSGTFRSRVYLPFELLHQRGVKVEVKKSLMKTKFNNSVLSFWAALIAYALVAVIFFFLYSNGKSSSLLVSDGGMVKSFTPRCRLYTVYFKSITPGSGNMIYVGTEQSGVLRFNGKTFKSTGPGLPRKTVRYLFFDYSRNRLVAVIAEKKWMHEGIALYYLEQGKWHPLNPEILQGKKIYYVEFRNARMLVSTDKGLYQFLNYTQNNSYEIFFKDRQVVKTFLLSGKEHVLTKRTTEKRYYQTLYRKSKNDSDDWEVVFKDIIIITDIIACDKWGSIWYAQNAFSLANPQSGDKHCFRYPGTARTPTFKKTLMHNGDVYIGLYFFTTFGEDTSGIKDWASVVKFNPEMKPTFTIVFDKIRIKPCFDMDFTIDRQGNIWTFSY